MTRAAHDLDVRVHAIDASRHVAERALHGQLPGTWTWLTPQPHVAAQRTTLHARPERHAPHVTEALLGEHVDLLEVRDDGWAWVRTSHDRYLGFARLDHLQAPPTGPTVTVTALRAHLYGAPDITAPRLADLAWGARVEQLDEHPVENQDRLWWRTRYRGEDAYLPGSTTTPVEGGTFRNLTFIRTFLDTPYAWGGRSAWGVDCSGLAQLFHANRVPRDANQQEAFLPRVTDPRAGDLAFFPGHVGIMLNDREVLHANATHMRVTIETLGEGEYGERLARDLRGFGRWTEPHREAGA